MVVSAFAVLWLRFFQRGPMEALVGRIANLARHSPEPHVAPDLRIAVTLAKESA
nr:hypothetical protein [Mesorhizobium sp.]